MRIAPGLYMVGSGQFGLSDALDCHVYLLDAGDELALIDAGAGRDPERILANIRGDGLDIGRVTHLFLTHSHADHAGGAAALVARTGATLFCSRYEAQLLESGSDEELGLTRAKASGIYPPSYDYAHTQADVILRHEHEVRLSALTIRILEVAGHSPGSLCYLVSGGERVLLFSGDTVFWGGTIGLGNWAGSSLADYREAIGRLSGLGVEGLFPGHYMWTLTGGQAFLDAAIENLAQAWVPPAWQHMHPHR